MLDYIFAILGIALTCITLPRLIKNQNFVTGIGLILGVCMLIAATAIFFAKKRDEEYERNNGVVIAKLQQPAGTVDRPMIGANGCYFINMGESDTCYLFNMPMTNSPSFYVLNNELYVDWTVKDSRGNVIVKMVANEWQTNPSFTFDKNHNDTSIEIIGNSGNVALQATYNTRQGVIDVAGQIGIYKGMTYFVIPVAQGGAFKLLWTKEPDTVQIPQLFRYPSREHQGELVPSAFKGFK